jgi:hypothetical protein
MLAGGCGGGRGSGSTQLLSPERIQQVFVDQGVPLVDRRPKRLYVGPAVPFAEQLAFFDPKRRTGITYANPGHLLKVVLFRTVADAREAVRWELHRPEAQGIGAQSVKNAMVVYVPGVDRRPPKKVVAAIHALTKLR